MNLANIEGDELVIRIPVKAFTTAPLYAFDSHFGEHTISVVDAELFAQEVARALNDEQEDGTTPVHLMLDRACVHAAEYGADGLSVFTPQTEPAPTLSERTDQ